MGYMGLDSWLDSDRAAELADSVVYSVVETLRDHLESGEEGGSYNTDPVVNVVLNIRALTEKGDKDFWIQDFNFMSLLEDVVDEFSDYITEASEDDDVDEYHIEMYQEHYAFLTDLCDDCDFTL